MGQNNLNLASLIGSRICHDLISPIGAINNGLELLSMHDGPPSPELELIADSVASANARIKFFRIAYGIPSEDHLVGAADAHSILADLTRGGRIQMTWEATKDLPRALTQCAFLAIQCIESALPYGGNIVVYQKDNNLEIRGAADQLNIDANLWNSLLDRDARAGLLPAQVQFALLPELVQNRNRTLEVNATEREITISL